MGRAGGKSKDSIAAVQYGVALRLEVLGDAAALAYALAAAGFGDDALADHAGRAGGEQQDAVGEGGGLGQVVGDEQGGAAPAGPCVHQDGAALLGERRVERDERFVQQQEFRQDGEGAAMATRRAMPRERAPG